jgi:hypothetical protein
MPFILFLISVIVSSSFYLVLERVTQDSAVNQALLASTAAFYTANSSAEVSWTEVLPEDSFQRVSHFDDKARAKADAFELALEDGEVDSLELNQGVRSTIVQRNKTLSTDPFAEDFYQSSGEVFLYKVPPDQVIDAVVVDYCFEEPCPELIIEWFRLESNFRFHELEELKDLHSDPSPINPCLDNAMTRIRRCVVRSSSGSKDVLQVKNSSSDMNFLRSFELQTDFPSYHYLIRFRTLDRTAVNFQMNGLKNGKRTGLPTVFFEVDELGQTRNTFRRIREQQMVSGGLQDGLEFVHYAEIVEDK